MGDSVPLLELHRLELEEAARGEALAELEAQLLSTDRNSSHVLGEPTLPASILAGPRLSSSRSANRDAASSVGSSSFAPAGRQSGQLGSARGSSTNPADLPGGDATQASSAHVKRLAAAPPSPSAWGGGQDAGTLDSKVTASNEERPVYTPVTEFRKVMTPPGDGDSGGNELLVSRGSSVQFDSSPRLGLAAHAKQPSRVQLLPPRSPLDNEAVVFEISDENSREAAGLYRPPLSRVIYGDLLAEPVVVGGSAEVLTTLDDLPGTPSSYHGAGKSSTVFSTPSAAETARKPIERGGNDAGQDFEFEASGHQPQKAREDVGVEWRSEMPEADEKQRRRQVARERWTKVRDTLNLNADQLAGADAPSSRHESTVRHHMTNSGPKRVLLSAVKPSDFDGGDAEGLDKAYRVYAYDSNVRSEKGMSRLESMRTRGVFVIKSQRTKGLLQWAMELLKRPRSTLRKGALKPSTDFIAKEQAKSGEQGPGLVRQRLVNFILPKKVDNSAKISFLGIMVPVIFPNTKRHTMWQHVMVLPLTYEAWAIPFRWAVGSPDMASLLFTDLAIDAWFLVDMCVQLCTALPLKGGDMAIDKKVIWGTFFRKQFFFFYALHVLLYIANFSGAPIWVWWVASGLRSPKIWSLWQYFSAMAMRLEVNSSRLQVIKLLIVIFLASHWLGCIFYLMSRVNDFREDTWVYRLSASALTYFDPHTASASSKYLLIIFKGGNSLTLFGYDVERPNNTPDIIWSLLTIVFQLFLAAYVLGTLFHYLVAKDEALEIYQKKVRMMVDFAQERELPVHLKNRLLAYMEFTFNKSKEKYAANIELPKTLELRIAKCQYKEVIDTCMVPGACLRGCSEQFINALLRNLHETYLMPGEEFASAGDIGRELGFVSSGMLDVIHKDAKGEVVLRSINGGNLELPTSVGEIAFFLATTQPYKIACRTNGDATLLVMGRQELNEMLVNYPEQLENIVSNVLANFGLNSKGEELQGWIADVGEDEELFWTLRKNVLAAVQRQQDDLSNQFAFAVNQGDVDTVKSLIRKGVAVDTVNYDLNSMAHLAAVSGNVKVLEALLDEGANKNIANRWEETPLLQAIVSNNALSIKCLFDAGARLTLKDPAAALCTAAGNEDVLFLGRLLECGVDPNCGDYDKRTAMHVAAATGRQKSVEVLLANGGNPNVEDRWGGLPLMDAVEGGHDMVTIVLKRNGARVSVEGKKETLVTRKLWEAVSADDIRMLQLLKDAGANLHQADYDGRCALHLAANKGKLLATSYLLSICVRPNLLDRWGTTAVQDALLNNHLHCAKLIKASGGVLGPSATNELKEKYAELDNLDLQETRELVREMQDKIKSKTSNKVALVEVHGRHRACVACIENLSALKDTFKKTEEKFHSLGKLADTMTKDLWTSMTILVDENIINSLKGLDQVNHWSETYNELYLLFTTPGSLNGRHVTGLTEGQLQLYRDLEELQLDSDVESVMSSAKFSDVDFVGGEEGGDLMPSELAKRFQSQVVKHLNQVQDGFDEFLDEFLVRAADGNGLNAEQIEAFLDNLSCKCTASEVQDILDEGLGSQVVKDKDQSITIAALWAKSDTFWEILKAADAKEVGQDNENGEKLQPLRQNKTVLRRKAMVASRELVVGAFNSFANGGRRMKVSAMKEASKSLGEFGAPLFKQIFKEKYLEDRVSLTCEDFLECFVEYLDPPEMSLDDDEEDDEVQLKSSNRGGRRFTITHEKSMMVVKGAAATAQGVLNWVVKTLNKIRVPIRTKSIRKKMVDRSIRRSYERAFVKAAGALHKTLRRQNMRMFLRDLLPRYAIREGQAEVVMTWLTDQPDGVTWGQLSNWLEAQVEFEEEMKMSQINTEAKIATEISKRSLFWSHFVVAPNNVGLRAWDLLLRICATYQFIIIPIQIASPQVQRSEVIYNTNLATDIIFAADILLCFFRAHYDPANSTLVTDPRKIFQKYKSGRLILDVLLAFPVSNLAQSSSSQFQAWLRFPKMLRLYIVYQWAAQMSQSAEASMTISVLRILAILWFITHILATIFLFIGEFSRDGHGWMDRGIDYGASRSAHVAAQYLMCLHYILSTLSSEGNTGELAPETPVEVGFSLVLMLLNLTLFSYILGEVSALVMKADDYVAEARGKQAQVVNFIKSKQGITEDLAQDIIAHVTSESQQGSSTDLMEIYGLLSHSLKVTVAAHISRDMLEGVELFRGCSSSFLDSLSVQMRESFFSKGDIVFRQSEVASELFVVVTGHCDRLIELEGDEPYMDGRLGPGDCLGDLSFFFKMRHIYTCKATTTVTTFRVERTSFQTLLEMFLEEADKLARNALAAYKKAWNRAGSAKSGASSGSGKSVQETMDELVDGNLKHTINMLERRQKMREIQEAMKHASRGNIPELRAMFASGVSVNSVNQERRTCLHLAACEGQKDTVTFLLDEMGADLSVVDRHGSTPMNDAVRHKNDEVADILRAHGAKLRMDSCDAAVVLCQAAFNDDLATIKRFVKNGTDPSVGDYDSRTALHLAASEGRIQIVNFLLEQGVDVNAKDRFGLTALVDAVRHGHRNVQLALRKAGALLPGHGTELCEAASVGDIDTIRVLIENGVDANEGDANGRTCLHLAACESQMGVIHFLLNCHTMPDLPHARKVEVNPVDINGGTPLDDALRHGNDVVAMLLRQYGAVCAKEGGEAMEEARRAQAKYNKKRFDKDVVVVSNEVLEGAREMRLVAPVGRYLEQLQEMETGIVEFHREIASLVHVIIKTERAFKEAKQPTPSGRARRQVTQEDTREKLGDVIPQLQDWHSAIDSPPSIKTPALRYLANPKAAESDVSKPLEGPKMFQIGLSHEEATVLEESQPRLLAMEALQRLWVVLGCLNDMVS